MTVIDDYLENIDQPQKVQLERIRRVVGKMVPGAEEVISYGMPAFKYNGKYLLAFAAFTNHMSIFPGAEPIRVLQDKLGDFQLSKGTIQFTLDTPLPDDLLKAIVKECVVAVEHRG